MPTNYFCDTITKFVTLYDLITIFDIKSTFSIDNQTNRNIVQWLNELIS